MFSRLHSNNLNCDCHLAWLSQWLRERPALGLFTQCSSPTPLKGLNVAEVQKHEFTCSGNRSLLSYRFSFINISLAFDGFQTNIKL